MIVKQPKIAPRAELSRVRAAAGRAGGLARWKDVAREPTVQVRAYKSDAERLKAMPGSTAEAIRALMLRQLEANHA